MIILTSNLGVREAMQATEDLDARKEIILKVVQASLRPELFNRISNVIPFNALAVETLQAIVRMHLSALTTQLKEAYRATLIVDDDVVARLAELAYDPAYGARPVERTIDRLVLSDLSVLLISGAVPDKGVVHLYLDGEDIGMLAGTAEEVEVEMASTRIEITQRAAEAAAVAAAAAAEAAAEAAAVENGSSPSVAEGLAELAASPSAE